MIKKFLIYGIGVCLLALPNFAFANSEERNASPSGYSEEELVALIEKLQKQLEEVRKNKVACTLTDVDLSLGDGEDDGLREHVKKLQNFLKEKGYFSRGATGYFGKITRTALINLQKNMGLEQTGELNVATRTAIKTLKCKKEYLSKEQDKKEETKKEREREHASAVTAIHLTGEKKFISWSVSGYAKNGFKVVWSKNQNPTYPTRDGDTYTYLSSPTATTTNLEKTHGEGRYYVRVCEYLGSSCGTYSNQIEVVL